MTDYSTGYLLTAVLYGSCLVGLSVNMIIVAANFIKWKSQRSLQTCDKILSSLAISRALFFVTVTIRSSMLSYFPWRLHNNIVKPILYVQTIFTFYSSNWIATVLCVFYCVKIVTYNYKLLIFLRTRIPIMVPRLILVSILISLISSLPLGWYSYDFKPPIVLNVSTKNMMEYGLVTFPNYDNRFLIITAGSFPSLIIFCAANSLLIHFLLIHTRRMRSNESYIQSPNLKCHIGAMQSMSLFLLLHIMSFICMTFLTSGRFFTLMFPTLNYSLFLCSLPLFHSLYMMSTSSEVRKMFTSVSAGA